MDNTNREMLEILQHLLKHMVAKSELAEVHSDLVAFRAETAESMTTTRTELREICDHLDLLNESVGGMKGYAKEIDDLHARMAVIEKHFGLDRRIAA